MAYVPHTWVHKERITYGKLNHIEEGIADAAATADEALASVDEALEAAESANTAAESANTAAEAANTAAQDIYTDKNFYLRRNDNGTVTLVYDDGE